MMHKRILILADIEGSSNCHSYESTQFLGKGWPKACMGMTRDVNAVVKALFNSGVETIIWNLFDWYTLIVLPKKCYRLDYRSIIWQEKQDWSGQEIKFNFQWSINYRAIFALD